MLPFLVLVLLLSLVPGMVVISRFALPTQLRFSRRLLLAVMIDIYLKLTEFQPGFRQTLLKLVLSREQGLTEVASIGGELCMHHLVRHRDANAERTEVMSRQFHMYRVGSSRKYRTL